jgi:hypothetical protein
LLAKDYCRIAAGKAPLGEAGANAALIEVEEETRSESESEEEERSQVQVQAPLEIEDDVIIFTHSAANLILATGIKKGYCKLGDKARWYVLHNQFTAFTSFPLIRMHILFACLVKCSGTMSPALPAALRLPTAYARTTFSFTLDLM